MIYKRISELLLQDPSGREVIVRGWVRTRRDSKDFSFLAINDGSCLSTIQVVVDSSIPGYAENVMTANTGASVEITGKLIASEGKEQKVEVKASAVRLIGNADPEKYPLQKKRHSNEFLRTIAHLRPRTNTFGAVFRLRSEASFAVHKFFKERGFVYLHSPIITTSDCEGAGEMFRVTTLDLQSIPRIDGRENGAVDFAQDFFGSEASLTVSGQLEGELFACALGNVYTFGPTFRAENSNTPRHLAEFWMIEPEIAFCDLQGNMQLAADFVKYVIAHVLDNAKEDMSFFNQWVEPGIISSLESVAKADFQQMTYSEAIEVLERANKKFEYPISWGIDLQTEHERYLTDQYVKGPVFITNYPKEIKAFYMRLDDSGKTVSAMDLLVPRLGEIIGGSQREEREEFLINRIRECKLPEAHYSWYLDTRRFGTVPHSGFGLGFERLLMYLTGMQNIRDVIPFPRTPGNASF